MSLESLFASTPRQQRVSAVAVELGRRVGLADSELALLGAAGTQNVQMTNQEVLEAPVALQVIDLAETFLWFCDPDSVDSSDPATAVKLCAALAGRRFDAELVEAFSGMIAS